jgi:hypothetical protein
MLDADGDRIDLEAVGSSMGARRPQSTRSPLAETMLDDAVRIAGVAGAVDARVTL